MKQLRRTIRKLILENKAHYDAVVKMILSEKLEDIEYALQLAEAAELIGPYTYKEETHYDSRTHKWVFHEWDEDFLAHLEERIKEINLFRRSGTRVENVRITESGLGPNGFSASFRLIEYPPYE